MIRKNFSTDTFTITNSILLFRFPNVRYLYAEKREGKKRKRGVRDWLEINGEYFLTSFEVYLSILPHSSIKV